MTTKAMAIQSGKMLKGKVTINIVFDTLKVLNINTRKLSFPLTFLQSRKCTFFLIAKVFVAKFEGNNVIRESLCPQFRDFFFSRKFLPAKVSAPKV